MWTWTIFVAPFVTLSFSRQIFQARDLDLFAAGLPDIRDVLMHCLHAVEPLSIARASLSPHFQLAFHSQVSYLLCLGLYERDLLLSRSRTWWVLFCATLNKCALSHSPPLPSLSQLRYLDWESCCYLAWRFLSLGFRLTLFKWKKREREILWAHYHNCNLHKKSRRYSV